MRITVSAAAFVHHRRPEDVLLLMGGLLLRQVATVDFAVRGDSEVKADFAVLGVSAACPADLAGRPDEFRFQGDCLGYIRAGYLAYLLAECRDDIQADFRAYLLGGCRDGSHRVCCTRDGEWSSVGGSLADDNPSCRGNLDDCSTRWVAGDTNNWEGDTLRANRPRDRGCSRYCGPPSSIPNHPIPRDGC